MIARNKLTTGSTATAATSFSTAPIAPSLNRLVLAFVANIRGGGLAARVPTAQGVGLTWDQVATIQIAGAADHRITCFRAMRTIGPVPPADPLTFNFLNQQQSACAWSVFEYEGIDLTGGNGANAVIQPLTKSGNGTTLSLLLGALADPAASVIAAGITLDARKAVNPGTGLAEIDEQLFGQAGEGGTLETEDRTGGGQTVDWSWTGATNAAAIALEIKAAAVIAAPPPDDPEILARRFEPVLFFHKDEKFFPCDAKRYVEQCALWRAIAPFDAKGSWTSLIPKGKIAAINGEPGTFLGNNVVDIPTQERFFDLAGWKDASGIAEPDVTASSKNSYSNRAAVANDDKPGGNQALRESRFWYHAEFIGNERLQRLLRTVRAPDLLSVLNTLSNAALLNYYFFFPAHEEALGAGCSNVEAMEFGAYAGEWACMSVILERDATDPDDPKAKFRPSFLGFSGRWLDPADPLSAAQAPADNDMAKRVVMKIVPFTRPRLIEEHPVLFVANGTHSLYLDPGSFKVVYGPGLEPYSCIQELVPPAQPPESVGAEIIVAKYLAGAALGFLGLAGLIAAHVWAMIETGGLGFPSPTFVKPTFAAPDETGQPGDGKVVRPKNLTVPGAGADVKDWESARGLNIGDRAYDFIVDRTRQAWWPVEPGEQTTGYNGRWGTRVVTDPFGRRAGTRFPPFWKMVFLALATGKDAKVI